MISRRNIRVKVMQTLYSVATLDKEIHPNEAVKLLHKHFGQSQELLIYFIYFFSQIAAYAETDAHLRSTKHLPTEEDLHVNTKISANEILFNIQKDVEYRALIDKMKPGQRIDRELVRKLYLQITETPEYLKYIATPERNRKHEREILEFILNELLLTNELFISHVEDLFMNWDDDAEMVVQLVHAYLQKPGCLNFKEIITEDKWDFAKNLLLTVMEKEKHLETFIFPKLKNWDADRIAQLDMILMKMGVAEFLYFETIPPKVTINEYIDLAKEYSTQQSGQFVNGILDNIHKELAQNGKLHKIDFKKPA
ncbi:MAG: transcription antitermination factor NusB [Chitinophagaceae bacterium]|nr:transcription antitermination factor NusB [Chitinophagaceae bacterium]